MTALRFLPALLIAALGLDCAKGHREVAAASIANVTPPSLTAAEVVAREPAPQPEAEPPTATRYAALSADACAAALKERGVPHETLGPTHGVAMPVRLTGPLSGIPFRTLLPEKERARSKYEILDCRLLLSLDDLAKQLAAANVVEVFHYSAYRPPPAGWLTGPFGLRHEGGLAMDVAAFRLKNGLALNVERDFGPRRGERLCTPAQIPRSATIASLALRKIVCDAFEAQLFHLTLTPDYDATHRDHFHFEVTPGKTDFTVR